MPSKYAQSRAPRHARPCPLPTLGALIAAMLWLPLPAAAQVPSEALASALALAAEAASALAPPAARVSVEPGNLDPRLSLAPCGRAEAYLPPGVPAWGRTRVGLRCTDGRVHWNVFLPVYVQVLAPALVSLATLPAGALLSEGQLARSEIDWGASTATPLEQAGLAAGRTLARPVAAGQPLYPAHLQPRQWFAQGDNVRILAVGSGFSIASEGQALGAGLEGKAVRVQTESGRVVVGRAISDRCVEVRL